MKKTFTICICIAIIFNTMPFSANAETEQLEISHPRIMASDYEYIKDVVKLDNFTTAQYAKVKSAADKYTESITDAVKTSYGLVNAFSDIAMAYAVEENEDYIQAALEILDNETTADIYTSYSPLSTGIALYGLAVAYDWLYPALTSEERTKFVSAIKYALELARSDIENESGWFKRAHNISTIVSSCLLTAAISIEQEEPEFSRFFIDKCSESLSNGLGQFTSGEGYNEGPHYWCFSTSYLAAGIFAAESALGDSKGILDVKGLSAAPYYGIYLSGPDDTVDFNYADSPNDRRCYAMPQLLYFAQKFKNKDFGYYGKKTCSLTNDNKYPSDFLSIMMYDNNYCSDSFSRELSTDRLLAGDAEVVSMRSAWNDENAAYVAAKGGHNDFEHSHLDAGDFSFSVNGECFVRQLGWEDYTKEDMFSGINGSDNPRYEYYINSAQGQNIFVLNPEDQQIGQIPEEKATVESFVQGEECSYAIYNLTDVYRDAARAKRGFKLLKDKKALLVRDEVSMSEEGSFWWFINTDATISVSADKRTAVLSSIKTGKRLAVKILGDGTFKIMNSQMLYFSRQRLNDKEMSEYKKLVINIEKTKDVVCEVLFTPIDENGDYSVADTNNTPLADWDNTYTMNYTAESVGNKPIAGYAAKIAEGSANNAEKSRDGSLNTYPILSEGNEIIYDFGEEKELGAAVFSFRSGGFGVNVCKFELFASNDNISYKRVLRAESSGVQLSGELYEIKPVNARYIKFVSRGSKVAEDNRVRPVYAAFFKNSDEAAQEVGTLWNIYPCKADAMLAKKVISVGEHVQAYADVLNKNGGTMKKKADRVWAYSSNPQVCRADGTQLTGVSAGTATISVIIECGSIMLWENIGVNIVVGYGTVAPVTEDTFTRYNSGNFGTKVQMYVKNSAGETREQYIRRAYIKIDTAIENKTDIKEARLKLYAANPKAEARLYAYEVDGSLWNETTLTQENAPVIGDLAGTASETLTDEYKWVSLDVTQYVKNSGDIISVVIEQDSTAADSVILTRESMFAPYLEVIYNTPKVQTNEMLRESDRCVINVVYNEGVISVTGSYKDVYKLDEKNNLTRVSKCFTEGSSTYFYSDGKGAYLLTNDRDEYSDKNLCIVDEMYYKKDGAISFLPEKGSLATVRITNNDSSDLPVKYIASEYSRQGVLSYTFHENRIVKPGETSVISHQLNGDVYGFKRMLWNSDNQTPLCKNDTVIINEIGE